MARPHGYAGQFGLVASAKSIGMVSSAEAMRGALDNNMKNQAKTHNPVEHNHRLKFRSKDIEIEKLLLDPNNYRFLDNPNYKKKIKTKYHLDNVQESTLRLLEQDRRYQLSELKKSIMANGYVPMERIIVVPYKYKDDTYLVIEGNRRVAALKSLLQENEESVVELKQSDVNSFSKIPCAVLETDEASLSHAGRVIMGIRHIAGPKEWGAYQQAQLVLELHDSEGYDFKNIGEHLGISTVEVARRYRAMKALKTMEEDDLYAEKADPDYYRLFHELVSLPDVRARFGWNASQDAFTDIERAREFYELIAPREDDGEAKLKTYSDVRKLKFIVGQPRAESILLDPEKSFAEALKAAEGGKQDGENSYRPLADFFREMLTRLERINFNEVWALRPEDVEAMDKIITQLENMKNSQVRQRQE